MDAQQVLDKHAFAESLYVKANKIATQAEDLWKMTTPTPREIVDEGNVRIYPSSKPRSILDKFRRLTNVSAHMSTEVLPTEAGEAELAACTKQEDWLEGYKRQWTWQTKRDFDRDATFWYYLRGRAYYEVRFNRKAGPNNLPWETFVDDPRYTYPVHGRQGILWYTKEFDVYSSELRRQYGNLSWIPTNDNEEVTIVEYLDDKIYRAVAKGQTELFVKSTHNYGFVPIFEALCLDTPFDAAEWAFTSVIAPIVDMVKLQTALASKMAAGVDLFYYPHLFYKSAEGTPIIIDPHNPGEPQPMAIDAKLEQVNVQVNDRILQQLFSYAQNEINLSTLPESVLQGDVSQESGFAISLILNQILDSSRDKAHYLQLAMGGHRGGILRLIKQFGSVKNMRLTVPT